MPPPRSRQERWPQGRPAGSSSAVARPRSGCSGCSEVESVSIVANPEDDVALLRSHASDPAADGLELVLTDGRAGGDDLFVRVRGT